MFVGIFPWRFGALERPGSLVDRAFEVESGDHRLIDYTIDCVVTRRPSRLFRY